MSAPADGGRHGPATAALLAGEDAHPEAARAAAPALPAGGEEVTS